MCKKGNPRKIDACMVSLLEQLSYFNIPTLASCCGHKKYPMTLVVKAREWRYPVEVFSGKVLRRKSRYYVKDKQGSYFVPETTKDLEGKN